MCFDNSAVLELTPQPSVAVQIVHSMELLVVYLTWVEIVLGSGRVIKTVALIWVVRVLVCVRKSKAMSAQRKSTEEQ